VRRPAGDRHGVAALGRLERGDRGIPPRRRVKRLAPRWAADPRAPSAGPDRRVGGRALGLPVGVLAPPIWW